MAQDHSESSTNVLLFGVGSIGAVVLYQLQQAGCKVTAVCRSNYSAIKQHGIRLTSVRFGNVTYRPDYTVRDVSEVADIKFDYIVVCSKVSPNSKPSLADTLRPVVQDNPPTAIILAQNGIMIENDIAATFPQNPVISCVIYCPANQTAPGVIDYPETLNMFEMGTYPSTAPANHRAAATSFAKLMIAGGGGAEVHDDIQIARWTKLLMNCVWNPICALTMCTDGDFLTSSEPFAYELAWGTMMEVVDLAQKIGIKGVTKEIAEEKFKISKTRAQNGTGRAMSMLQDVEQSRPLEVEAILGNVVKIAKQHDMKLLRLETLYALVMARSAAIVRSRAA